MKPKKITKRMLMNYYSVKDIKDFLEISSEAALDWLEEANRFFYKLDPTKWNKDEEMMKKIGW